MSGEIAGLRLLCRGVVQGVGFRPWLHRLATELGLDGSLTNGVEGVSVELSGPRPMLECFLGRLARELPAPARLESLEPCWGPATTARGQGVRIAAGPPRPLGVGWFAPSLAPDRAPCADCLAELADPTHRRFGDPFISCARCGPRYSIALATPYRRAHTTLANFPPCEACRREFADPGDRRFHAETISCPRCGPRLRFWSEAALEHEEPGACGAAAAHADGQGDPLEQACALLAAGQILALQGVGGFQLLVDAANSAAVARLRRRKRRPAKPFALLVADGTWLEEAVWIDAAERKALGHGAAPIVLLGRRPAGTELWPGVAPGSPALGVMRPASPLHHLLVHRFGRPLVATSGNRSGEPLCTDPLEARQRLAGIADAFLVHDRPIARPLDDSLLQVIEGRPVLLRRARGYAPEPLTLPEPPQAPACEILLALSGDLKCAPGLAVGQRFWLAPHLGDLADRRCQERLVQGLAELTAAPPSALGSALSSAGDPAPSAALAPAPPLAAVRSAARPNDPVPGPETPPAPPLITLIADAHPGYVSHQWARASGLPLRTVQHHLAHALAVIAEHGLEPPVLAAAFDGLGYGEPLAAAAGFEANQSQQQGSAAAHALWGGELLLISRGSPEQPGVDVPGGVGIGACPARLPAEPRHSCDQATGAWIPWQARHLACLRPFPLPGGERAMREPRRAALGLLLAADLLDHPGAWRVRQAFAPADLELLGQAVAAGCQAPLCSSAGRLFDGAASLLGLVQVLTYEGEGGLRLQGAAARALSGRAEAAGSSAGANGDERLPLLPPAARGGQLDWEPLLRQLLEGVAAGTSAEALAAGFHGALAEGLASALATWADQLGLAAGQRRVALAGGCFQNRLLLEATSAGLRHRGLEPWWSQQLPGNDGGLALGQVWAGRRGLARTVP
jgi:hydrogenase maturation protein HypF